MTTVTDNDRWIADPKAEDVLKSLGVIYTIRNVSVKDINWKESEKNIGRQGFSGKAFSQSNVDDYSEMMKRGDRFPMPVFAETDKGLVIAAGNHRSKAAVKAGMTHILAYVYKVKLEHELRLVAFLTNRKEGVRVDQHEAMEYALHLCLNNNLKPDEVAKLACVNVTTLHGRIRAHGIRKQLAENGYNTKLSDNALKAMSKLTPNSKVLVETCKAIETNNLPVSDDRIREFIKPILSVKTEAQQLAVIETHVAELRMVETPPTVEANGHVKVITLSIRKEFLRSLNSLYNVLGEKETLKDLQIEPNSEDSKEILNKWNSIRRKMNVLFK